MKLNGRHKVTSPTELIREATFNGSFSPVTADREALVRLGYSGLVKRVPKHGTFVTGLSPQGAAERMKIRNNLEVTAASEAATRATDKELRKLSSRLPPSIPDRGAAPITGLWRGR